MTSRTSSCPNCGAEITFRWSGAVQTTCPACKSVLVRHDLDLERVGTIGDVPASMSRIQLGTDGVFKGKPFTVVGRIVYKYARGHWSEWYIRFANDDGAWLSDAQSEYAVTQQVDRPKNLPAADDCRPGSAIKIGDDSYTVASITRASYAGVEGELPFEYWDKDEVAFADLKKGTDSFATIDYSEEPAIVFVGEYEEFDELRLKNLREEEPSAGPAPRATGLNCPACGAAIELRIGELAQTIACPACTAILDASDASYKILTKFQEKATWKPTIPLGATGVLKGKEWQVVGFRVAGIEVEGIKYNWREYLLSGRNNEGFRYLTEYDGHWNDVSVAKGVPQSVGGAKQPEYEYLGTRYKHFQHAIAQTRFILGEFPWEVRVNDEVDGDDFVSPPFMLSRESTGDEITWSLGTYTPPERIAEAFKLKEPLPKPRGVFSNQPNPRAGRPGAYMKTFALFAVVLLVLAVGRHMLARNERVFNEGYHGVGGGADTAAFVTPEFTLSGHTSNVRIDINTGLANDWAFFNFALLSADSDGGYEFARDVSYYTGTDSDGSWSEGSPRDRVVLPSVPPGRYYLRIEPERDQTTRPFNYSITVTRDVPRTWPFVLAFLALLIPPIFALIAHASFEQSRWAESDYAPTSSDDDE